MARSSTPEAATRFPTLDRIGSGIMPMSQLNSRHCTIKGEQRPRIEKTRLHEETGQVDQVDAIADVDHSRYLVIIITNQNGLGGKGKKRTWFTEKIQAIALQVSWFYRVLFLAQSWPQISWTERLILDLLSNSSSSTDPPFDSLRLLKRTIIENHSSGYTIILKPSSHSTISNSVRSHAHHIHHA